MAIAAAPESQLDRAAGRRGWPRPEPLVLLALVLLTRLGAVWTGGGWHEGETDSALFSLGTWRWSRLGAHASLIYDARFSAGYYWLTGGWAKLRHLPLAGITPWLDGLSLAAALGTAVLAWALARRFVSAEAAFWASVLFLLVPGVWELGIEPHPQGLGICLALGAFYLLVRAIEAGAERPIGFVCFAATLTAALLVRSDTVFLYPAFLLAPLLPRLAHREARRRQWLNLTATATALACAAGFYLLLRAAILGESAGASEATSWHRIAGFVGGLSPLRQVLPIMTGLGPLVWALAIAGVVILWRRSGRPRAWAVWIIVWAAPGSAFWLLIRGNNARHMAIYSLPLLWFACEGWARVRPQWRISWLAMVAVAALAFDCELVPASSNVTIYPSGNVPASARDLARRETDMRELARHMIAQARSTRQPVYYLGTTTTPYVLLYTLETRPATVRHEGVVTRLTWATGTQVVFHNVFSAADYLEVARRAQPAHSLEYDARGGHLWFFGQEWRWLPMHGRWYVRRAVVPAGR